MRILCFGDSNTYGYDPRVGGRYPADSRWTDILGREAGHDILNAGLNGRCVPAASFEADAAVKLIQSTDADTVIIMLGSNDLLLGRTAEEAAMRMEAFLRTLPDVPVLLIAPPTMQRGDWVTDDRTIAESARLAPLYAALASRLGCAFADAGTWEIDLSFDGVHFTEAGHRTFAGKLADLLK